MGNKIKSIIIATLVVLSICFIVWSVGLIIPRYWLTAVLLIYCIYILYRVLNPKKKYYFVTYWFSNMGRGRIFIPCDKFRVCDIEKDIAKYFGVENVIIDYYRQISKEEYEFQTNQITKKSKRNKYEQAK